jgi:hypothetical protein
MLVYAIGLCLLYGAKAVCAQTPLSTSATSPAPASPPTPSDAGTPTLHVYTNLKQVPVLVLTPDHERTKSINTSRFRVSIDSGPRFRPTYIRREGDDPISLAILIDVTNPENELLPPLIKAIPSLSPDFLHPQDRVSIYVIDCSFNRTAYDAPANPATLAAAVDRAMAPWQIRRQAKDAIAPCKQSLPLWDSMAMVLDDLIPQLGRRVLLAITDGQDTGSKTLWSKVMNRAQVESIAVFGLMPLPSITSKRSQERGAIFTVSSPFYERQEDRFDQICELSGGVELQSSEGALPFHLKEFTQMVRERYILEFPRGRNEEPGVHTLDVSLAGSKLYIRPSGISVPVASEDEVKGASTLPADPSREPAMGKRKVLPPQ